MADLTERVDACVGAAGAVHNNSLLGDFSRGGIDFALNRREAGLELPAWKSALSYAMVSFILRICPVLAKNLHQKASGVKTPEELQ